LNRRSILHASLAAVLSIVSQAAPAAVNRAHLDAPAAAQAPADRNTEASPHPAQSRNTGKAQQVKGQAARGNPDRVRSLLNRQALRSRTPKAASRRAAAAPITVVGDATRASGNPAPGVANLSPARANPSPGPASAPNKTARRAAVALPQNSAARTGMLGGPRAQGYARLGGPASGKAAHAAALDGTQVARRKY
jgi:hypothetical protein